MNMSCVSAFVGLLASTLSLCAMPARGCDLALLLAIDVSGSVDDAEYRLQIDGTADALQDPEVRDALVHGQVALAVVQWSAVEMQRLVIPWQTIDTAADVARLAPLVRAQERAFGKADTAVADALSFAAAQFDTAPDCNRRVIDISGDGVQNSGASLPEARRNIAGQGIVINAIAIEGMGVAISEFYRRAVITRGGFVQTARGHLEYPKAIRAKLLREIVVPMG
ncbi:MAG: DUF1194 domain-containing protein [Albidovulum sp.]